MSATRTTPPPTPTMTAETLVALALTIRRLFSIYLFLPTLMAISPFVLHITYFLLNRLTKNHALLSLMLTGAMTSFCQDFIARSAPTKKDARESLEKCRIWLPMIIFALSAIVIHGFIAPLGAYLDATWLLTWSPKISFSSAFRIAIGMCFLSLSLLCRYVGPRSVVRCSPCLLRSRGISIWFHKLQSKRSFEEVIAYLTRDSDTEMMEMTARRYQRPGIFSEVCVAQFLCSAFVGYAVTCTLVQPLYSDIVNGDDFHWLALFTSCFGSILVHVGLTAFNGKSHELNPRRYTAARTWSSSLVNYGTNPVIQRVILHFSPLLKSAFSSAVMVLIAATTIAVLVTSTPSPSLAIACFLTFGLTMLYLHVVDEATKALLCTPTMDIYRQLTETLAITSMGATLDVIMHSILHSDFRLVKQLCSSSDTLVDFRNAELQMAENLISGNRIRDVDSKCMLEKDILRSVILESFGGSSLKGFSPAGPEGADPRHIDWIKRWVQTSSEFDWSEGAAPLVRGFCAYAGGLGEALIRISGGTFPSVQPLQMGNQRQLQLHPLQHVHSNFWKLPPGAIVCAEFAIVAAARCVILSFSSPRREFVDWKSTRLSMLVPAVLHAAFHLQNGVKAYSRSQTGVSTKNYTDPFDMIRTENPELESVFCACNNAASAILQKLQSLEGARSVEIDVGNDCKMWTKALLSKY